MALTALSLFASPQDGGVAVAAGTILNVATTQAISSQSAKPGDTFAIELVGPLVIDGKVMIPIHARGIGQVVHAARQINGKTGELILAARYLIVGNNTLPLRSFRINATGQRTTTRGYLGAGTVVTVLGGTEVEVPAGTAAIAKVSADTEIPCGLELE